MAPGPDLAAALASVEVSRVSGHDQVVVLGACERQRSHYAGLSYAAMAAISDSVHAEAEGDPRPFNDDYAVWEDAAAAEIQAALRWTKRTAERELGFAHLLRERLPAVHAALLAGRVDVLRARVLVLETVHVDVEVARTVVDSVLHRVGGWTTTQLKRKLRSLCIAADPDDAQQRYTAAVDERRVVAEPSTDGTCHVFGMNLPPDRVAAAMRHVNHLARSLAVPGEARTMDQRRADVFLDLCGFGPRDGGKGTIDLRVDVATLVGLTEGPAELGGYGPILADLARQLTQRSHDLEWRYGITDPDTGRLLRTGITRRRPTATERRGVEQRDETCIFPGCVAPATDCDLDHRTPWSQGGPTDPTNLGPNCEPHHTIRHAAGWTYRPFGDNDYLWTTRLGHRYTTSGQSP